MFEVIDSEDARIYIIKSDEILNRVKLFEEDVDRFIKTDKRDIVIDMRNLTAINSLFLSCLIRIKSGLFIEKRIVRLVNYNEKIYRSLEVAGLDSYFQFE